TLQRVQSALPVWLQEWFSAWALLAATSSPLGKDWTAARSALLLRGTSPRSFEGAPELCSAVSTAKKFPSARLNLPAPATDGLLRCRENEPGEPARDAHVKRAPVSECPISIAGWQFASVARRPLCRAAAPCALDCES